MYTCMYVIIVWGHVVVVINVVGAFVCLYIFTVVPLSAFVIVDIGRFL